MLTVVCVSGLAESGKTTFSLYLKKFFQKKKLKTAFINYGDYVKFIAKKFYNWNEKKDKVGRGLLQYIGTERGRNAVDEDIWVNMVINTIKVIEKDYDVIIIGDARFVNEFKLLEKENFNLSKINIIRPNHKNKLTFAQLKHESEQGLKTYSDYNYKVYNCGRKYELKEIAEVLGEKILNK